MIRTALLAATVIALFPDAASARVFDSVYTRLDYERCASAPSPEPAVIDVRVCKGYAATAVVWTGEPDSSDVAFGSAPVEEKLALGPFYEAGGTIEWRTRTRKGISMAAAAIVRYAVGENVGALAESRLVVYRLEPSGRSCVMGVIDGARTNANAEARQLADRYAQGFVCGRSPRL